MDRILQNGTPLRKNRKQITIAKIEKNLLLKVQERQKLRYVPNLHNSIKFEKILLVESKNLRIN